MENVPAATEIQTEFYVEHEQSICSLVISPWSLLLLHLCFAGPIYVYALKFDLSITLSDEELLAVRIALLFSFIGAIIWACVKIYENRKNEKSTRTTLIYSYFSFTMLVCSIIFVLLFMYEDGKHITAAGNAYNFRYDVKCPHTTEDGLAEQRMLKESRVNFFTPLYKEVLRGPIGPMAQLNNLPEIFWLPIFYRHGKSHIFEASQIHTCKPFSNFNGNCTANGDVPCAKYTPPLPWLDREQLEAHVEYTMRNEEILCDDSCIYANDGVCNDITGVQHKLDKMKGTINSCRYGTDCSDCGERRDPLELKINKDIFAKNQKPYVSGSTCGLETNQLTETRYSFANDETEFFHQYYVPSFREGFKFMPLDLPKLIPFTFENEDMEPLDKFYASESQCESDGRFLCTVEELTLAASAGYHECNVGFAVASSGDIDLIAGFASSPRLTRKTTCDSKVSGFLEQSKSTAKGIYCCERKEDLNTRASYTFDVDTLLPEGQHLNGTVEECFNFCLQHYATDQEMCGFLSYTIGTPVIPSECRFIRYSAHFNLVSSGRMDVEKSRGSTTYALLQREFLADHQVRWKNSPDLQALLSPIFVIPGVLLIYSIVTFVKPELLPDERFTDRICCYWDYMTCDTGISAAERNWHLVSGLIVWMVLTMVPIYGKVSKVFEITWVLSFTGIYVAFLAFLISFGALTYFITKGQHSYTLVLLFKFVFLLPLFVSIFCLLARIATLEAMQSDFTRSGVISYHKQIYNQQNKVVSFSNIALPLIIGWVVNSFFTIFHTIAVVSIWFSNNHDARVEKSRYRFSMQKIDQKKKSYQQLKIRILAEDATEESILQCLSKLYQDQDMLSIVGRAEIIDMGKLKIATLEAENVQDVWTDQVASEYRSIISKCVDAAVPTAISMEGDLDNPAHKYTLICMSCCCWCCFNELSSRFVYESESSHSGHKASIQTGTTFVEPSMQADVSMHGPETFESNVVDAEVVVA